jgi:activator of HSP90 ATPase
MEEIQLSVILPATSQQVYDAWLSSKEHAAFTGAVARINNKVGSGFIAWDGYITGKNLELDAGKMIRQSWRTDEFPVDAEDSLLEITLEDIDGTCKLLLKHRNIPDGQGLQYEQGWKDFYFTPMKAYFNK